jgi:stress-induced-phosphoprotein 1
LGNQAFKAGNYAKAIEHYSEALKLDASAHTYWSNRSASYAGLGDWENAANDAAECVKANKKFVKGYFRLALAQKNLQRYEQALDTIMKGLGIDFGNSDLKSMKKEIEDAVRLQKVASYVETAKQQFASRDYGACLSTIESGLRIDAGNAALVALKGKVQPLWEQKERARKAGLSPVEKMKEEGDALYKDANFEAAIAQYSKTLDKMDDQTSDFAMKVLSNRAACHKQLSNFDGVISDCTSVLEVRPDDVKSLLRRAQAFEAVERYKMALQDVRTLLALPADVVGPSNTSVGASKGWRGICKDGYAPVFRAMTLVVPVQRFGCFSRSCRNVIVCVPSRRSLYSFSLMSAFTCNLQIANGLQHRLNRVIQKLRDG